MWSDSMQLIHTNQTQKPILIIGEDIFTLDKTELFHNEMSPNQKHLWSSVTAHLFEVQATGSFSIHMHVLHLFSIRPRNIMLSNWN